MPAMPILREHHVRQLFAAHGLKVCAIRCNRHWRVKVARDDGSTRHFTISTSPGDQRTIRNIQADLKRFAIKRRP
jgi:hypothetical protein